MTNLQFFTCEAILRERYPDWRVSRSTTDIRDDLVEFTLYRNIDRAEVLVVMDIKARKIVESRGRLDLEKLR